MKKESSLFFIGTILVLGLSFPQIDSELSRIVPNTGARYVSDEHGTIRMYVNIWGHVSNPGRILVNEGIDLSTLLSLTGGPNKGANLKRVRVYHEYPDNDGNIVHVIDLTNFIKTGDRSSFIDIQPNDTFIIKQTAWSYIIEEINTINTLMNVINLYLNLTNLLSS